MVNREPLSNPATMRAHVYRAAAIVDGPEQRHDGPDDLSEVLSPPDSPLTPSPPAVCVDVDVKRG